MGLIEKTGGRKWWLAVIIIVVLLFVLVWLTVTGRLEALLAGILVGGVTTVKGLFAAANTANNKAALAAGKVKDAEADRLGGLSDSDVLAVAGAATGVDIRGAVDSIADGAVGDLSGAGDACRAGITQAADAARGRLRGAATPGV